MSLFLDDDAGRRVALTVAEVAKRWSTNPKKVYELMKSDGLPFFKLGPRSTRIWMDELESWEAKRRNSGGSGPIVDVSAQSGEPEKKSNGECSALTVVKLLNVPFVT